jgi:prepilin-type N-terminal cleavage/methylation domain-containing protein
MIETWRRSGTATAVIAVFGKGMIAKILNRKHRSGGFSLVEVLVATAIMGIIAVVIVGGLSTSSKTLLLNDVRQTAKNVAETQMEYIKNVPYAFSYTPPSPSDSNFSSTVSVATLPGKGANIQKITINVAHQGKPSYTLEGYKVN